MRKILTEESLRDIWENKTLYSANGRLVKKPEVKDIKDIEVLNFKKIKSLLDTFPPVWAPVLTGFEVVFCKLVKLKMHVSINKGFVSYEVATLKCSEIIEKEKEIENA